jgi:HSP20 family protein
MAKGKNNKTSQPNVTERQSSQSLARSGSQSNLTRPDRSWTGSPFSFMRRFSEEMDRLFDDFGVSRGWNMPTFEGGLDRLRSLGSSIWSPQIEVFERDNQLIIRADLPGMSQDDVNVEIDDNALLIRGERKSEQEENSEGYYRSERSYGTFYRRIPLPQGINADEATADFRNGVLEVKLAVPERAKEKRRQLEIRGEDGDQERSKARAAGQGR